MWLIVGLGNPGAKYELTRHNIGFLVIDALLDRQGIKTSKKIFGGHSTRFDLDHQACVSLKPESFMNRSGTPVLQALSFHKIDKENLVVIHDDLDLPLDALRIKRGGGNGGHNGLKDISRLLGPDFIRIRLGIGRPLIKGNEADYVLSPFNNEEWPRVEAILTKACDAVDMLIREGFLKAQERCQIG
jgi:PTH1 family peptidyl-tRNA hydrolase